MKNIYASPAKSKYSEVSELGSRYNMSFSSQMAVGNKVIALDGIKKLLLVVDTTQKVSDPTIIDLKKVTDVTVKKSYGSINNGELKEKGIEHFLKRIDLQFQSNKSDSIAVPFYDEEVNDKGERAKMARNAKNWQMILSKMVGSHSSTKKI